MVLPINGSSGKPGRTPYCSLLFLRHFCIWSELTGKPCDNTQPKKKKDGNNKHRWLVPFPLSIAVSFFLVFFFLFF